MNKSSDQGDLISNLFEWLKKETCLRQYKKNEPYNTYKLII